MNVRISYWGESAVFCEKTIPYSSTEYLIGWSDTRHIAFSKSARFTSFKFKVILIAVASAGWDCACCCTGKPLAASIWVGAPPLPPASARRGFSRGWNAFNVRIEKKVDSFFIRVPQLRFLFQFVKDFAQWQRLVIYGFQPDPVYFRVDLLAAGPGISKIGLGIRIRSMLVTMLIGASQATSTLVMRSALSIVLASSERL